MHKEGGRSAGPATTSSGSSHVGLSGRPQVPADGSEASWPWPVGATHHQGVPARLTSQNCPEPMPKFLKILKMFENTLYMNLNY